MLPIERIGGGQFYHTREAHPLAAGLFFAVLEPFMGYGPNVAYGTTGITLSSSLALADMTPWGMLALGCDGTTDRSLTYATPYDAAPFTYGCFVRPDFTSAAARDALARGNVGSGNGAIALGSDAATMRYRASVRLGGTVYSATATVNLVQRQWVFIAMSYDSADLRLYVSDLGTFTTAVNAAYTASGASVRLGMRGAASTARWNGAVGASFGWSRVLSEAELTQIAQDVYCRWLTEMEPPARSWHISDLINDLDISVGNAASDEAFGALATSAGTVSFAPNSTLSDEAFGALTLSSVSGQSFIAGGLQSGEAFGSSSVTPGAALLIAGSATSDERYGSLAAAAGSVAIYPGGHGSEERYGRLSLAIPGGATPTRVKARGVVSMIAEGIIDTLRATSLPRVRAKPL